jgi:MFS family permease
VLDGLEASLIANLGPTLMDHRALGLTATQVGLANTAYLVGQVVGALVFGHATDRLGRKKLFLVTLGLYLCATAASGLAPTLPVFVGLRFLAGSGIGGEYAAINSAIDELVPARIRGQIDLGINGSYWIGAMLGAILTLVVLDPAIVPAAVGWRLAFGLGALLGLAILIVRRSVPESPRWLLMHGRVGEAHATVERIEREVGVPRRAEPIEPVRVKITGSVGYGALARTLAVRFPGRAVLGFVLIFAQAVLYNSLFFSIGLILHAFHGVPRGRVGVYMIPFAIGNFLGPITLGPLFDRLGRRVMIPATYGLSAILLLATGALFAAGVLTAATQTIAWCLVFFVASAAGSAAYLTVSELFPVELRGKAIAVFYAFGTLVGAGSPLVFGHLVASGSRGALFGGYAAIAVLLGGAAIVARKLGVDAERRSLESLSGVIYEE